MLSQLSGDLLSQWRIDRGEGGCWTAYDSDFDSAVGQCIRHLQSDVTCSDNHSPLWFGLLQKVVNAEAVIHGVQQKDSRQFFTRNA